MFIVTAVDFMWNLALSGKKINSCDCF